VVFFNTPLLSGDNPELIPPLELALIEGRKFPWVMATSLSEREILSAFCFIEILFSMLLGSASPNLGEFVALKVIAVSIVAGLGNLKGGLVCGLLLGIAEAMAMGYISGSWSNAISFILMLMIVLIKPQGLFGTQI
jgi:branched-chain amino acid transport system permease protein